MKLIVGLGNPGKEYEGTRHNIGFEAIRRLAKKLSLDLSKEKFHAHIAEIQHNHEKLILALPQTYMNLSGKSVAALMSFYKINPIDLVVVHDDLDLPLGKLKVVYQRGAAGNHGVESIENSIQTNAFCRFRIGIGRPLSKEKTADFVLKPFMPEEKNQIELVLEKTKEGLEIWIKQGIQAAAQYCHQPSL